MMPKKVLLIEDDPTMRNLLKTFLSFEKFEVSFLDNERDLDEAIQLIRITKPDVILLDVHLRQFNGFDLLQRLRSEEDLSAIRVLMSSGTDVRDRCMMEGANGFILKPYLPDELVKRIRQLIGEHIE